MTRGKSLQPPACAGYDDVPSIERIMEDPLLDPIEGFERTLVFLMRVIPTKCNEGPDSFE